jgi:hypothetical protein
MVKGVNSSVICLIYCKNFCKCHNVLPPSTTIKKFKEKAKERQKGIKGEWLCGTTKDAELQAYLLPTLRKFLN